MVKISQAPPPKEVKKETQTREILKKMYRQSEEEQAAELAKKHGLFYIDLNLFPINADDVNSIPEKESRNFQAVVFQKTGKDVRIAIVDPISKETLKYLEKNQKESGWRIRLYVASLSSLKRAWDRYQESSFLESLDFLHMSLSGKDLEDFEKEFGDLLDLKKRITEIPTTEVINIIMAGALKMKASDIHFEPQEEQVRMRYRVDGVLQDIGFFPMDVYRFLLSRIKMMGKMKINIRDIAQDGHFSIEMGEKKIDIRINIIPGRYGESVVMRLLNQDSILKIEELGVQGLAFEQIKKQIAKSNGMILTTGPTGSGKTTTLYALIGRLNNPDVKIITIEDPVEYEMKGISQTQVDKSRGYDFSNGLKSIVRQDPDVILVGEIRDEETADIAINSALTGHLVLSTLHSNNASASIPRLIELGVKPGLIAPSVNAIVAQRLVRRLCPHCKEKYEPAKETIDSIKKILSLISPKAKVDIPREIKHLYKPVGCPKCHTTGYQGRIGIFEILVIDENIEKLILEIATENEITQAALENGLVTMAQDGILKAVEGVTSMEEVWRVSGQTEFLEEIYEKLMDQTLSRALEISGEDMETASQNIVSFDKLNKLIQKTRPNDLIKIVFASALLMEAGDIHIEPGEKDVVIRFRIDGILQNAGIIPLNDYLVLLGNIKSLSGLKTESREGSMDSRFGIILEELFGKIKETKMDVRVSIIVGGFGETVVMRILNKSAVTLETEKLGIRKQNIEKIMKEIKKPNGLFLNTGPTGSGKTTTLYSLLSALNKPEVKIITTEDPIEYQLKGILQTQVDEKNGYTFPKALKSLLRQNPDIVMIGEIRDEETADIAIQAALTGHLVFSTLHTNDAAASIQRLLNMGARADDLAISANAFMSQRLVRQLCDCKKKVKAAKDEKEKIENILKSISPVSGVEIPDVDYIYKPGGCEKCNGIGYKGRTVISEVLIVDKDIEEMISRDALSTQIKEKAVEKGMITLVQDGILKVLEGETTLEEVERVAGE